MPSPVSRDCYFVAPDRDLRRSYNNRNNRKIKSSWLKPLLQHLWLQQIRDHQA